MFHDIDMDQWERKAIYQDFIDSDCSYAVTTELSITKFLNNIKNKGLQFYPSFIWVVLKAINSQRGISDGV